MEGIQIAGDQMTQKCVNIMLLHNLYLPTFNIVKHLYHPDYRHIDVFSVARVSTLAGVGVPDRVLQSSHPEPKFSLNLVIPMVIFHKPHPMHTFNPKSCPHFASKFIETPILQIRQILDPIKPTKILWNMIMAHHHPTNLLSMIVCSTRHRSSQKVLLAQNRTHRIDVRLCPLTHHLKT